MGPALCKGGAGLAEPDDFTGAEDTDAMRRKARRDVVRILRRDLDGDERELARLREAVERTAARVENVRAAVGRTTGGLAVSNTNGPAGRAVDRRDGFTRKVIHCGFDMYVTVNPETPEVFIKVAKEGGFVSGLLATVGMLVSVAMQHGVPWSKLRCCLIGHKFEPSTEQAPSLLHAMAIAVDELLGPERKKAA